MASDYTPSFPEVVDSTMRSSFVDCPQKFYQEFIRKRTPKGGSVHLIAGGAYAKGLELIRTYVYGPDKMALDDAIARALPYVFAEYGDFPVPAGQEHKSPTRVAQALVAYFDRFPPSTDHIQPYMKENGYPAVEFTFSFPTQIPHPETGNPILYCGRSDMIGIFNDSLWVVDDKTATSLGPSWAKSFELRGQLTGYTFAARQYGLPVQGAIIRGTSFLKTGAYGFLEPIEYRAQWSLERWWVQLHRDIMRMIDCWKDQDEEFPYGYWDYALADACNAYGGCPFKPLCTVANPENWVSTLYEFRDWDPMAVNPLGLTEDAVPSTFSS